MYATIQKYLGFTLVANIDGAVSTIIAHIAGTVSICPIVTLFTDLIWSTLVATIHNYSRYTLITWNGGCSVCIPV